MLCMFHPWMLIVWDVWLVTLMQVLPSYSLKQGTSVRRQWRGVSKCQSKIKRKWTEPSRAAGGNGAADPDYRGAHRLWLFGLKGNRNIEGEREREIGINGDSQRMSGTRDASNNAVITIQDFGYTLPWRYKVLRMMSWSGIKYPKDLLMSTMSDSIHEGFLVF